MATLTYSTRDHWRCTVPTKWPIVQINGPNGQKCFCTERPNNYDVFGIPSVTLGVIATKEPGEWKWWKITEE